MDEESLRREPGRRVPEIVVGDPDREEGKIHERMPAAPSGMEPVRQAAHNRIRDRIGEECHHDRKADPLLRKPQDLVVVHEQEEGETVLLHPKGYRAEAVVEFG